VTGRPSPPSALERAARALWRDWGGAWAKFTACHRCGELAYCGAARRRGPYLCLECFDVSEQAAKAVTVRREQPTS
jgi:hypothetical protein